MIWKEIKGMEPFVSLKTLEHLKYIQQKQVAYRMHTNYRWSKRTVHHLNHRSNTALIVELGSINQKTLKYP